MGDDKLHVLWNFNLAKFFNPERAALIKSLWNGFAKLYDLLGEIKTDPQYFRLKAKVWYELFLKKTVIDPKTNNILEQGLYRSSDKTLKNGGNFQNKTSAICEILEHEN
ncbi:hypothetical protein GLOIN_2v1791449 [Rhizophagus irregularis DAOM 181602=DAOM 197198]|uniref:Uncharacterized protein n=1 Tax=Rhizophagus irregularis (strain DAOM 181602 / DAOM 197198 / MUCL 43194) TaxID=747089 RepID=A0A2P4NX32_RHIID|nr:hypothetical protein GLOIN_2v1791449 [Rhizophagus irregularis DAOM 181602=DAOM 197198]POG57687.1 hypothetical protein GLOIN_2v1791449 [Rhizophagus irregularis DAOM 181602=DAOM 197198]|eukprot:XP_025164553.1 hypothetical protein GLOIN_2v1791449 [Rhizophagus irregularis DAOM 181602=DAOM 197198]